MRQVLTIGPEGSVSLRPVPPAGGVPGRSGEDPSAGAAGLAGAGAGGAAAAARVVHDTHGGHPAAVPASTAVWSPRGRWVAYALEDDDPDGCHEVRRHLDDGGGAAAGSTAVPDVRAFYLSPSPCGRRLAHLSPGPLGLELGVTGLHDGTLHVVERGAPLFWAWSPGGGHLAVHVGRRVLVAGDGGASDGDTEVLTERAGSFVAPWWRPDGSVLYLGETGDVVLHRPGGTAEAVARTDGPGRCVLDPSGTRLALVEPDGDRPRVVVLDLRDGARREVASRRTAGFSWSPDGSHLAVLVPAGPGTVQWLVDDGEQSVTLEPFRPAPGWLRAVLPFFEQYAHSHSAWSADGEELVAPSIDADGSTEALVQTCRAPFLSRRLPGARLAWWAD